MKKQNAPAQAQPPASHCRIISYLSIWLNPAIRPLSFSIQKSRVYMHLFISHFTIILHGDPNIIFIPLASIIAVWVIRCFFIFACVRHRVGFIRAFRLSILGHRYRMIGIILIVLMSLSLIGGFVSVSRIRKFIDLILFLDRLNAHLGRYF